MDSFSVMMSDFLRIKEGWQKSAGSRIARGIGRSVA